MGGQRFFANLRQMGILNADNTPRQTQINNGNFRVYVKFVNQYVGTRYVTLVTNKGLMYLAKIFNMSVDRSLLENA